MFTDNSYHYVLQNLHKTYLLSKKKKTKLFSDILWEAAADANLIPQDACMLWSSLWKYRLWFLFSTDFFH